MSFCIYTVVTNHSSLTSTPPTNKSVYKQEGEHTGPHASLPCVHTGEQHVPNAARRLSLVGPRALLLWVCGLRPASLAPM